MSVAFEYLLRYPTGEKLTLADPDEVDRRLDEFSTSGAEGWLEISAKVVRPTRTKRASSPRWWLRSRGARGCRMPRPGVDLALAGAELARAARRGDRDALGDFLLGVLNAITKRGSTGQEVAGPGSEFLHPLVEAWADARLIVDLSRIAPDCAGVPTILLVQDFHDWSAGRASRLKHDQVLMALRGWLRKIHGAEFARREAHFRFRLTRGRRGYAFRGLALREIGGLFAQRDTA